MMRIAYATLPRTQQDDSREGGGPAAHCFWMRGYGVYDYAYGEELGRWIESEAAGVL